MAQGWLWSRLPLTATNFIIEVEFKVCYIHSLRDVPFFIFRQIAGSTTHLHGDGLALWMTSERAQPGPVFGSKGKRHTLPSPATQVDECKSSDYFTGIGIFLDTCVFCTSVHTESELTVYLGVDTKMTSNQNTPSPASLPCRAMERRVMMLARMACRQ